MKKVIMFVLAISLLSGEVRATNWTVYSGWNGAFCSLNLNTGEMTDLSCSPGFWHLDFAPDGTLYGLNRLTDKLYKITNPQTGTTQLLTNLPGNSGGDPIAVSPDGSSVYFTYNIQNQQKLYKYDISSGITSSMTIGNLPLLTGMNFGKNGTLYGIDGYNGTTKRLWTINLQTLQATAIGPRNFGLNMEAQSTASAFEVAPDGTFYLAISPTAYNGSPTSELYYVSTLNPATGIATTNHQAPIHHAGSSALSGL